MTVIDHSKCDECGTCISVCPCNALVIDVRLSVSPEKCASCGACVKVCPFGALGLSERRAPEC